MKKINLKLSEGRSYTIVIGRNLLPRVASWIKPLGLGKKILVVTNRTIKSRSFLKSIYSSLIKAGYEVIEHVLAYGNERDKSKDSLFKLWRHMAEVGLERSSTVLAVGGGVVGDLAGFAASTYMRGIFLVQVPTTLLAQVDAAIGGKTAINLPLAKNIVGTFYQPRLVVSDVATLARMGVERGGFGLRELRNSFAEIIKYGIIMDPELFRLLEEKVEWFFSSARKKSLGNAELSFLETVVWRSAQVKARVVEEDERETKGKRIILNYGHTFAHAFETASGYRLPHGEAVGLGMVCAARLARKRGLLSLKDEMRQNRLIQEVGLPSRIDRHRFDLKQVKQAMLLDKKRKGGRLRFVLPEAIGRVRVVAGISSKEVEQVLEKG